jgi:hypothetical protein
MVVAQVNDGTPVSAGGPVTVHFPSAGFYPIEMDNAENADGLLYITLDSPQDTPVPKAPPYQWGCTISLTPSPAPTAPNDLVSYYVEPTYTPGPDATATPIGDKGYWYDRGYAQADQIIRHGGPPIGISILDFGEPAYIDVGPTRVWGTRYIYPGSPFFALAYIKMLAADYAHGFYDRATQPQVSPVPQLILAIGTSNDFDNDHPLTATDFRAHGQQWGLAVEDLAQTYYKYYPVVRFQGASDIEFGFSDADRALTWAQGFEEETGPGPTGLSRHFYYAYGSCDGCYDGSHVTDPNIAQLGGGWTVDQAVGAVFANAAAIPVPEIYYDDTIIDHANQPIHWQWLSSYADTHYIYLPQYGIAGGIYGPMQINGPTADGVGPPTPTPRCCISPSQAWMKLWQALNESSCSSTDYMFSINTIDYRPYDPW